MHKLAKDGVGVIVISDDLSELVQNCNKILVMRNGKAVAHIDEEISENELYKLFSEGGESLTETIKMERDSDFAIRCLLFILLLSFALRLA